MTTGVRRARREKVVIADDDVRYDRDGLDRVAALLDHCELVRPQNYFDPMPWHAGWDTARSLLNRTIARDYPGTFGLRRSAFLEMGGYDGDVLFENLELLRTVRAAGGRESAPLVTCTSGVGHHLHGSSSDSGFGRRTTTLPSRGG